MERIVKFLGNILTCFVIVVVIFKIKEMDIDYKSFITIKNLVYMFILIILYSLGLLIGSLSWKILVEELSKKKISIKTNFLVYAYSNILKYIPGNVFQYVGRNTLATKENIKHTTVALATVIDVMILLFTGLVLSIIFCGRYTIVMVSEILEKIFRQYVVLILISSIVMLVLFITIIIRKKYIIFEKVKQIVTVNMLRKQGICLCLYTVYLMLYGVCYWIILNIFFDLPLQTENLIIIIGASIMAWTLGFITPGAPGGLGIREMSMSIIAGSLLSENIILVSMVILRLITTCSDLLLFLISLSIKQIDIYSDKTR